MKKVKGIYSDHPSRPQKEHPGGTALEKNSFTTQWLIGSPWIYSALSFTGLKKNNNNEMQFGSLFLQWQINY